MTCLHAPKAIFSLYSLRTLLGGFDLCAPTAAVPFAARDSRLTQHVPSPALHLLSSI
jgi:hypothetical protein